MSCYSGRQQNYGSSETLKTSFIHVVFDRKKQIKPAHEMMAFFVLHKLILKRAYAAIQLG